MYSYIAIYVHSCRDERLIESSSNWSELSLRIMSVKQFYQVVKVNADRAAMPINTTAIYINNTSSYVVTYL